MASLDDFKELADLLKNGAEPAVKAAQNAAARVYVRAAKAAAPKDSGQLEQSIGISRRKETNLTAPVGHYDNVRVGPSQKMGYYGYFLEKDRKTAGPHRVSRRTGLPAHTQRGVVAQRVIPGKPWFEPAIKSAHDEALRAAEAAFESAMRRKGK